MNIKSIRIIQILLFSILIIPNAVGQDLYWAQESFGGQISRVNALDVNPDGYSVLTGGNFFVARYNTEGSLLWKVNYTQTNNTDENRGTGICQDKYGNIFVVGYFRGELKVQGLILSGANFSEAFVAKFDSTGTIKWLTRIGGSGNDYCYDVEPDQMGNCYIVGNVNLPIQIGSSTVSKPPRGLYNSLLAKIDSNGNLIWSQVGYGTFSPKIETNKKGELYIQGQYQHWVKWGNDSIATHGQADQYVAKVSENGNFEWLNTIGNEYANYSEDFCVDENGHVTVYCGMFDDFYINDTISVPNTGYNHVLVSFDELGLLKWDAKFKSDTSSYSIRHIVVLPDSSIGLFGLHTEIIDSTNYQNYNIYGLTRFQFDNLTGALTDTLILENYPSPMNLELDGDGNMYLYGFFLNQISISDTILYSTTNWYSSYLAKVAEGQILKSPKILVGIYPNPFSDKIIIVLEKTSLFPISYSIFNMNGQEVLTGSIDGYQIELSTTSISSGVYLIRVGNEVFKMIKN